MSFILILDFPSVYTGSCSPVQRFVRDLKQAGPGSGEAFSPLHFAAGNALQFD